jgi:hypothetical protein
MNWASSCSGATLSPLGDQTIVIQNRDTLCAAVVFDLDAGPLTITLPDPQDRFLSKQTWNQDQYTPGVVYEGGTYTFTKEKNGSRYLLIGLRILVNTDDSTDGQ